MEQQVTQVCVGIIFKAQQHIFVTQRPKGSLLAGYWEFPGGKLEHGELPLSALSRELHEEVGITVEKAVLLKKLPCVSADSSILLHYFLVTQWQGEPSGCEGQAYRWVNLKEINFNEFPKINRTILIDLLRSNR